MMDRKRIQHDIKKSIRTYSYFSSFFLDKNDPKNKNLSRIGRYGEPKNKGHLLAFYANWPNIFWVKKEADLQMQTASLMLIKTNITFLV